MCSSDLFPSHDRRVEEEARYGFRERVKITYRVFVKYRDSRNKFIDILKRSKTGSFDFERSSGQDMHAINNISKSLRAEIVRGLSSDYSYLGHNIGEKQRGISYSVLSILEKGKVELVDEIFEKNLSFEEIISINDFGKEKVYDIEVEDKDHLFVANGFVVSNCSEGQLAGGWREKPISDLTKGMDEILRSAATNKIGYISYNLNYYRQFLDLMKESAVRFSQLSLINERADVIAAAPEYLRLAKVLGLVRVSMAVEGMGNRIRNLILNKNLSREQLMRAVRVVFEGRFIVLKCVTPETRVFSSRVLS